MHQIEQGIVYEDSYLGVTVGALIHPQGIVLIDAPIRPEDTRAWRSAIITGRSSPNRYLVNLDAHPDRTLGARALEAVIVAHQKAAQVFRNRPTIFKGQTIETGAAWENFNDAIGMRWGAPDITFSEQMSMHLGGAEILLEHHPGPTPGSCWVIVPAARVIFVGDHLVLNQPPFLAQADMNAWLAGLDLLASEYGDYRIVSGRGGLAGGEDVQRMNAGLRDILARMEKLAEKNSPPEATQELIAPLMGQYPSASHLRDIYATRLRYGLHQCYARRYRPATVLGQPEVEEEEQ